MLIVDKKMEIEDVNARGVRDTISMFHWSGRGVGWRRLWLEEGEGLLGACAWR